MRKRILYILGSVGAHNEYQAFPLLPLEGLGMILAHIRAGTLTTLLVGVPRFYSTVNGGNKKKVWYVPTVSAYMAMYTWYNYRDISHTITQCCFSATKMF